MGSLKRGSIRGKSYNTSVLSYLFLLPSEALEVNGSSWQGMRYGGGGWDGAKFCEISIIEAREAWLPW